MSPVLGAQRAVVNNRPVEVIDLDCRYMGGPLSVRVFRYLDVLSAGERAACAAMSLFLLFVWLEARQQQFRGKGRVRRARAVAELLRAGRFTLGVP